MQGSVEYLQRLGLTEYQAKVMVVLFSKGKATAKEICKFTGIAPTKIYEVLKSLGDKEFLSYSLGKPRIYRSKKAYLVLNKLIRKYQKRLDKLRGDREKQIEMICGLNLEPEETTKVPIYLSTEQYT